MISTQSTQSIKSFTDKDYNNLSYKIIECCMEVHNELGPGLMESVYEIGAEAEMKKVGLFVQRQVNFNVSLLKEGIRRKINGNLNSV